MSIIPPLHKSTVKSIDNVGGVANYDIPPAEIGRSPASDSNNCVSLLYVDQDLFFVFTVCIIYAHR